MPLDPSFRPKALLVGSGPHLHSARVMLGEAGFSIAEEITHPSVAVAVLDKLKTGNNIDVALIVFLLSETYREDEDKVIRRLRSRPILCIGSADEEKRPLEVTDYMTMSEGWVASLYTHLVELRKRIETAE